MIFTDRKITIRNGKSSINEPVILYRGDFEVSITFTIMESKFRFRSGVNLVDSEKASYGQLAILAPYGGNVFSDVVKCEDGTVTFTLTKEMIDQLEEVGLYSFQIRLFDYYRESRVSIPPVEFGIEVREPVASEDHDNTVNNAIVGYSIAKVVNPKEEDVPDTFNANGQYNKTNWKTGDRISEGKLNKIEDALDKINKNEKNDVAALDKRVTNNFNVLDANKVDKNEVNSKVWGMANMGQDVKEAMTGGSVAVVGPNAVDTINIKPKAVTADKINVSCNLLESIPLVQGSISGSTSNDINLITPREDRCVFDQTIDIVNPEAQSIRLLNYTDYRYAVFFANANNIRVGGGSTWHYPGDSNPRTISYIAELENVDLSTATCFKIQLKRADDTSFTPKSVNVNNTITIDSTLILSTENIKNNAITADKLEVESVQIEHLSEEVKRYVGVTYTRTTATEEMFIRNQSELTIKENGDVIANASIIDSSTNRYDWACMSEDVLSIRFTWFNNEQLFVVLCANDASAWVMPILNSRFGSLIRFDHDIQNVLRAPIPFTLKAGDVVEIVREDTRVKVFVNNEMITTADLLLDATFNLNNIDYGMGILLHASQTSYIGYAMRKLQIVGNEQLFLTDTVENNTKAISELDTFVRTEILKTIPPKEIKMNASLCDTDVYWGPNGASYVKLVGYIAYRELVPVNPGAKLRLTNWFNPGDSTLAYSAYDNDGYAYNHTNARINFSAAIERDDAKGMYLFEIPEGTTQIGLSAKSSTGKETAIIEYGYEELGETMERVIDGKLTNFTVEADNDLSSVMYQKGASVKKHTKKIGIIAAGQSNTDGRVPFSQLPSYITLPMSNTHIATNYNGKAFRDTIQQSDYPSNGWAYDLVTYHYASQVAGYELYIMRYTMGGTSIDPAGATDYHWTPFYEELSSLSYSLLWQFEDMIRKCVIAKGNDFDIRAMIWHQGEGDVATGPASRYYHNLKYMIAYCRGIVGNQRLPFICGTVPTTSQQYSSTVDKAYKRLNEEDPYFYLVDMAGAPLKDAYHFNNVSNEYFGKKVYDYLIDAGVITGTKLNPTKPW